MKAMDKVSIEFYKLLNLQLLAIEGYRHGFLSRSLLASLLECSLFDLKTVIDEKKALWPEIAKEEIAYKLAKARRVGITLDEMAGALNVLGTHEPQETYQRLLATLANCAGATERLFNIQMRNIGIKEFGNEIEKRL